MKTNSIALKETSGVHQNGASNLDIGHSKQELIAEKHLSRRKKIIMVIICGATVVVAAAIVTVVILLDMSEATPFYSKPKAIELEDLLNGVYAPKGFNGTWVSGHEILYRDEMGDVRLYNTNTLSSQILLPADIPGLERSTEVTISADHKYLLVAHDVQKLFRYSSVGRYTIVDIETQGTSSLTAEDGDPLLQFAIWSTVLNAIIFVCKNNIYYRPKAMFADFGKITTDGVIGEIYNGVPDWVYEEEVLSSNKALWISPDGKKLAFAKFNDKDVKTITIPVYGEPGNPLFQYTKAIQIRYPKCGTPNPIVSLHVANLEATAPIVNLEIPTKLAPKEPVLATVAWATPSELTAIWMNRVQNEGTFVNYNMAKHSPDIILEVSKPRGWLDLFTPPTFSKDGSKMIFILSHKQKHKAGHYRHVTILNRQPNSVAKSLTNGTSVVTSILAWDERSNLIYYLATLPNNSAVQHLFSVSTVDKITNCLSCKLYNSITENECLYNTADFSTDAKQYVLNCEGPGVPESIVFTQEKSLGLWENNAPLQRTLQDILLPTPEKHSIPIADGLHAMVLLQLPPNMDRSGKTKYPMVVNVYAGPDSNQVLDRFSMDWGTYLSTHKNMIYAAIDGRGSGLKGDRYLFALNRRFGTVEVTDQINVTKQLHLKLPYIDHNKTAIWGWSYGGYVSSMALATDTENIFKCGAAVAPVTDWALYDSIYTERFMGLPTPEDNLKGYAEAQLFTKHEGIRDKQYFLIHGTLDDNVHYHQSLLWAKVLEQKDILFREMSYTDEDHSLLSVRPHLYHSMERFLDDCFKAD